MASVVAQLSLAAAVFARRTTPRARRKNRKNEHNEKRDERAHVTHREHARDGANDRGGKRRGAPSALPEFPDDESGEHPRDGKRDDVRRDVREHQFALRSGVERGNARGGIRLVERRANHFFRRVPRNHPRRGRERKPRREHRDHAEANPLPLRARLVVFVRWWCRRRLRGDHGQAAFFGHAHILMQKPRDRKAACRKKCLLPCASPDLEGEPRREFLPARPKHHHVSRSASRAFRGDDLMGIVHHSNYVLYFEAARVTWLRRRGVTYATWAAAGIHLPVVDMTLQYKRPARFEDELVIETTLAKVTAATLIYEYRILRGEELLTTGMTRLACVGKDHAVRRIPAEMKSILVQPEDSRLTSTP